MRGLPTPTGAGRYLELRQGRGESGHLTGPAGRLFLTNCGRPWVVASRRWRRSVSSAAAASKPYGRASARVDNFRGYPLQLFAGAGARRQRDQAVADLRHTELPQLAPQRRARPGRLSGQPVTQQHPFARLLGRIVGA